MTTKFVRSQSNLVGVGANQRATVQVQPSGNVYGIFLSALTAGGVALTAAQMIAEMSEIRVTAQGTEIFRMTPRDLLALTDYHNGAVGTGATPTITTAGELFIPFWKPKYPGAVEQDIFGLGAGDVKSLIIEVLCAGAVPNLGQIQCRTWQDDVIGPTGQHIRVTNYPQQIAALGDFDIINLPREPEVGVLGFHIVVPTTYSIDNVIVYAGPTGTEIRNYRRSNLLMIEKASGKVPQTPITNANTFDMVSIDFTESNDLNSYLQMAGSSDLRIRLTGSGVAPGSVPFYREAVYGLQVGQAKS